MKKLFLLPCFLVCLIGFCYGADVAYKFTILDLPIKYQGRPDILRLVDRNNKGEMIGVHYFGASYYLSNNRKRPVQLDCGGDSTVVSAINNQGQIVGTCSGPTESNGFVHDPRTGSYTLIRYPGSDGTVALGINDLGHVVGQYWGFAFGCCIDRFHAFIWKDGVYSTVDAPDPDQMGGSLFAINKQGQAIGDYFHHVGLDPNEYDTVIPFLYDNGSFSILDFPGGQSPSPCCEGDTFPYDINNLTQIVGASYDSAGSLILFLFDDDRYFKITGLPENFLLNGVGINDKSEIAGSYFERVPCATCGLFGEPGYKYILHSFIAVPAPQKVVRW
jgi:hypothetical protein